MLRNSFFTFLILLFGLTSKAQFFENFTYPQNSQLVENNWKEHSGNGSNPILIADGLSFRNLNEATAGARMSGGGQDLHQSFSGINSGTVYTRFLIKVETASQEGDYFFHHGPTSLGTDFKARVFAKNEDGKLKLGLSKSSNNPNYAIQDFEFQKVYLLVLKYTFNDANNTDDTVGLAIISELGDLKTESLIVSSTIGESDLSNLGSIALRQGNNSRAPTLTIDEIKVSNSWSEATQLETLASLDLNFPEDLYAFNNNCRPQSIFQANLTANRKGANLNVWSLDAQNISFSKDQINWVNQLSYNSENGNYSESFYIRFKGELQEEKKEISVLVDDFDAIVQLEKSLTFGQIALSFDCSMAIAQARNLPEGENARITGVVTASAGEFGGFNYLQDGGSGIRVNGDYNWEIGDSLSFLGQIGLLNQEMVMLKDTCCDAFEPIQKRGVGAIKIANTSIENIGQYEGKLVQINNAQVKDKNFVFLPNTNERISDATGSLETRIWSSTNIDGFSKPQITGNWQGVVGRFRDRIQLYPRKNEDIEGLELYEFPPLSEPIDESFDLAAWNVEWFGSAGNGPFDDELQLANVTQTLLSLEADAFVLTEVSDLKYFDRLVATLPNHSGTCSPAVSGGFADGDAQRICLVYKKDLVTLVEMRPLLKGTPTILDYPESFDRFWATGRLPALFVCDVELNNVKKRLHIVGIHARANRNNAEERELVYQMRKKDLKVLKDSLDLHFSMANVIMAGDFNDDLDESVVSGIQESSYKAFVDDNESWSMLSKALSDKGYKSFIGFDNVIDHIGISNELNANYIDNSVFLALPFLDIPDYPSTTSDHLPIIARFSFNENDPITSNELMEVDSILVYPNPTSGEFNININHDFKLESILYDQKGVLLLETKGNRDQIEKRIWRQLKKSGQGLYLLKLIIGNEAKTYKIVNQ